MRSNIVLHQSSAKYCIRSSRRQRGRSQVSTALADEDAVIWKILAHPGIAPQSRVPAPARPSPAQPRPGLILENGSDATVPAPGGIIRADPAGSPGS